MTSVASTDGKDRGSPPWARKYPPLLAVVAALLIALAVLPSSLNLPQSNPTQTLEFAPVPPEDEEEPPPPQGNLSSLGLAGSQSIEGGGLPGGDELPGPVGELLGQGKSPFTKACVTHADGKLRQTEDPLSPPCVADFRGDNFGTTYTGVTGEEVRILFYFQGFQLYVNICKDPNQATPDNEYFDLAQPPQEDEHCVIRILRVWQKYFNERYQTYGRFVHFFVYVSGEGRNAEERKADAAENYAKVKPFAVVSNASSFTEEYLEVMARRGVLNFGSFLARGQEFFNQFPGLIWGYLPSLEKQAETFGSYLCQKVAPHPVEFSRNGDNGQPRVYGLWRTRDETRPELIRMAEAVEDHARRCGIEFAAEHTFPAAGYVVDNETSPRHATTAVADFSSKGVTTVIWPGGLETNFTKEANRVGYLPEIIAMGDGELERESSGTFQDPNGFNGAVVVTSQVFQGPYQQEFCYRAYRETDPSGDDGEVSAAACPLYPDLRQLFIGIQVAGPRLTPETVDQGFHAIPAVRSPEPTVPACFYDPGDYTCVKDAMVERWDSSSTGGASRQAQGCFRATQGGLRYFAGIWPEGNVKAQDKPDDPCNQYGTTFLVRQTPPEDPTNF